MADKPQPHTIVNKIGEIKIRVMTERKLVDVFKNHAHDIVTLG